MAFVPALAAALVPGFGTAAAASTTLGTIGAGVSAVGTIGSAMYSAQVARNNATIEQQNAKNAIEAGQQQAQNESLKGAAQEGRLKAAIAANGVDVNTGSAVDVEASQRETDQLNTENIFHNAQLQNYGYRTQAANDEAQAEQDEEGGILGAAGSLLSKASGISTKWLTPESASTSYPTIASDG